MMHSPKIRKKTVGDDRISSLPDNSIEAILDRLPLRDAVRTSVLCRAWRYEWTKLSVLEFDYVGFDLGLPQNQSRTTNVAQVVDHVRLLHQGPIRKFKLNTHLGSSVHLDRWIQFLSGKGIQEFLFESWGRGTYVVHSRLFSCSEMIFLELGGCVMKLPASFTGFSNLTKLCLSRVSTTQDDLHNLISNCPLLKKLSLMFIDGCTQIKLSLPNLVDLQLDCSLENLIFVNTPVLARATIHLLESPGEYQSLSNGGVCKLINLLGCLPNIKRLQLSGDTYQVLSSGTVPVRLPTTCQLINLFVSINFDNMQHMLAALCIFRSSTFLQKIVIKSTSDNGEEVAAQDICKAQKDSNDFFSRLRVLVVTDFIGTKGELKFTEFVLANAPVLEIVQIKPKQNPGDVVNTLAKVTRFRRISPKAELDFQHSQLSCSLAMKHEEWDYHF